MQKTTSPSVWQKLKTALARDPKKTSLMAGLGFILIFLWLRMGSNSPAAATASFIRRSVTAMALSPSLPSKAPANSPLLDWLTQPRQAVQRNLFAIKLDYYARATDRTGSPDSSEDPTKSDANAADQTRERRILVENLQGEAAKLKLQTTVMGPVPGALVNGELVKEGDSIAGFKVDKIEARRVVIEQDGVVLEIGMP